MDGGGEAYVELEGSNGGAMTQPTLSAESCPAQGAFLRPTGCYEHEMQSQPLRAIVVSNRGGGKSFSRFESDC